MLWMDIGGIDMLDEMIKAPDFELYDEKGELHRLSDYKGQKVVVYFYPKDSTPGCTKQACTFREHYEDFKALNVKVIGISKDSQKSHARFIEKNELPFLLLSDPDLDAIKAYDVWQEKKMYGKTYMGVVRSTYVIDEEGMIVKVYKKASPTKNPLEILEFLK